jgi:hypothetical protein
MKQQLHECDEDLAEFSQFAQSRIGGNPFENLTHAGEEIASRLYLSFDQVLYLALIFLALPSNYLSSPIILVHVLVPCVASFYLSTGQSLLCLEPSTAQALHLNLIANS